MCSPVHLFRPNDTLCTDNLNKKFHVSSGYHGNFTIGRTVADSVCKAIPTPYHDFFEALLAAKPHGPGKAGGHFCEVWMAQLTYNGMNITYAACIDSNGVPRQYNMTASATHGFIQSVQYIFSNISIGHLTDEDFAPSEACAKRYPVPACSNGGVQSLDLYRVRSASDPNSLDNRNLGDALGDMAFFCATSGMDENQVVTRWSVLANTSWGQYGYCLYQGGVNRCYGNTGKQVGRESAIGLGTGPVQGQCSPNDDVGSWFAFPSEGSCPPNAAIGTGGCTWTAKPERTVSAACILHDRGLKQVCAEEIGHAPMIKAATIFRLALESSDPAKGGCPDITEAADMNFVVV